MGHICSTPSGYDNRGFSKYYDEEEKAEDLELYKEEWLNEFAQNLERLTVDTERGDKNYREVMKNLDLTIRAIKEYYREDEEC